MQSLGHWKIIWIFNIFLSKNKENNYSNVKAVFLEGKGCGVYAMINFEIIALNFYNVSE